jgi:hypothetical protein
MDDVVEDAKLDMLPLLYKVCCLEWSDTCAGTLALWTTVPGLGPSSEGGVRHDADSGDESVSGECEEAGVGGDMGGEGGWLYFVRDAIFVTMGGTTGLVVGAVEAPDDTVDDDKVKVVDVADEGGVG